MSAAWIYGAFGETWLASDIEFRDGKWREKVPEPRIIASPSKLGFTPEEVERHARLIAAAPDLLAAIGSIRSFSSAIERGEEPWREGVQEITRMALAAIAKTECGPDA